MFHKDLKSLLLSLIVGCLYTVCVQSKECYSCEGINCQRTSKVTNKITCVDPLDNCVTIFDGFSTLARGCYTMLPEHQRNKCDDMSNLECHKCFSSLCNDKGAISCIQCNSEANINCNSGVASMEATRCPVSTSANSYCYTRRSEDKFVRGCLVDTNEQLKCLGDTACEMCIPDGLDTCNREAVVTTESGSKCFTVSGILLMTTWLILSL